MLCVTLVLGAGLAAKAFDDVPDYRFLVHMAVPVDGTHPLSGGDTNDPSGAFAGDMRTYYQNIVETYWKEVSYHEADPETGFSEHGFYIDSKTYGYVWLPWPAYAGSGVGFTGFLGSQTNATGPGVRADSWVSAVDPRAYATSGRPVSFAGEHNYETGDPFVPDSPGQLFGGSGPLIDGYWTPGERFQDVDDDGEWGESTNVVIVGEDWWDSANTVFLPTNWPGPREIWGYNGSAGGGPDDRGELFADYDGGSSTFDINGTTFVTVVDFDASATIFIADGAENQQVNLSEHDLTPNNNLSASDQPSREGDFFHEHILDPSSFITNDIPTNSIFEYQINPNTGLPLVIQPDSAIFIGQPLQLTYQQWQLGGVPYVGTNGTLDGATLVDIEVPVYQATELWGGFFQDLGDQHEYIDDDGIWDEGFVGAVGGEPFEDFISWWIPFAGADGQGRWLGGLIGGCVNPSNMPNLSPLLDNAISCADYEEYIRDNYPGDAEALIARMGNNTYDGPDNWLERIDNKMQIVGLAGALSPEPTIYPGGNEWWDPHDWFGGDWTAWWTATFGSPSPQTYGSPYNGGDWWPGNGIPNALIYSNLTESAAGWVPPLDSSWGYDSPREYQDLPSSIYHTGNDAVNRSAYADDPYPLGGDLRLGEVTSPFGGGIWGHDLGNGNPNEGATFDDGDGFIPAGGPLAYNGHGQFSFDALNVLSLEVATWRTDGESLSGPQSPLASQGNGIQVIAYGGDHRDVNLDGLIDQGETVPPNSHSYFIDDDSSTEDGGLITVGSVYPFNWDRYAEDAVEAWDYAEDYGRASRYSVDSPDELISGEAEPPLVGIPASNIVGTAAIGPHGFYVPGDGVWIDEFTNCLYDADVVLNPPFGSTLVLGTNGTGSLIGLFQDLDGDGEFDWAGDNGEPDRHRSEFGEGLADGARGRDRDRVFASARGPTRRLRFGEGGYAHGPSVGKRGRNLVAEAPGPGLEPQARSQDRGSARQRRHPDPQDRRWRRGRHLSRSGRLEPTGAG